MNQMIRPETVNFTTLVLTSNTVLSLNVQSKLVDKLNASFTDEEQRWYVANFFMYLNYHPTDDYPINLEDVLKMMGFAHKKNAKRTLENNFKVGEDYKVTVLPTEQGRFATEEIMLNIDTFKNLCMMVKTEKGKLIRKYYVKLENIFNELFKEEMKAQLAQTKQLVVTAKEQERHDTLLEKFATAGPLLYFIKVKSYDTGEYIIKAGETRIGVESRLQEHRNTYGEAVILDCFLVSNSKEFESFLLTHPDIKRNKVTDLDGHETKKELIRIDDVFSYNNLIEIVNKNIHRYKDNSEKCLTLEVEKLRLLQDQDTLNKYTNYNETKTELSDMRADMVTLSKSFQELKELIITSTMKTTNVLNQPIKTLGDRVQKIHKDTLHIVKVYESIAECMLIEPDVKRSTLCLAVEQCTLYRNHRWKFVDRGLPTTDLSGLKPTKATKHQNLGYIAKLNSDKTVIVNVYLDRKSVASLDNVRNFENVVKHGTLVNNHYYVLYDDCTEISKTAFGPIILYKDGVGKFDANDNLIKEFTSRYHCASDEPFGAKTLIKILDAGIIYQGHTYKTIGSKLKM